MRPRKLEKAPDARPGPKLVRKSEPAITHDVYERIAPGEYRGYCRAARIYRDPGFRKWVCVLRWDILDADGIGTLARIPQWLYIGRKPHATRRAQFWREWNRANGGAALTSGPDDRVSIREASGAGDRGRFQAASAGWGCLPSLALFRGSSHTGMGNGAGRASTSVLQSHIPKQHSQVTQKRAVQFASLAGSESALAGVGCTSLHHTRGGSSQLPPKGSYQPKPS